MDDCLFWIMPFAEIAVELQQSHYDIVKGIKPCPLTMTNGPIQFSRNTLRRRLRTSLRKVETRIAQLVDRRQRQGQDQPFVSSYRTLGSSILG